MPVSHLGLTVSHIPSATSFYLAALAPLGYRYIGQSGDSVGLGIEHADLFLTQEPRGQTISPAHVAFDADSRLTVRNCYAAALSSGGYPSGAPSYRDRDCTVFNAAVEDLDGNVIEFIHKDRSDVGEDELPSLTATSAEQSRVLTWQEGVASSGLQDDSHSLASRASRAKSRAETVKDLLSSASRSTRTQSEAPSRGITRAQTLPVGSSSTSEFPSKAFFGTMLGATAGAALAWAMMKSEGDSSRDERAFSAATRSRSERRGSLVSSRDHRDHSATGSETRRSHRNFSTTESAYSRKYPPRSLARSRKAIAQMAYYDDERVRETISRYSSSRRPPAPQRSKTIDAIEYAPVSNAERSMNYTTRRSATMPVDRADYYLEGTKPGSTTSRRSGTSRHETRRSVADEDLDLKRRDSGISMGSHRSSHHSRHSRPGPIEGSHPSSASTIKPSRRGSSNRDSAADVPLPASKAGSYASRARDPIPESRAASYVTAAEVPIPESRHGGGYATDPADESDGIGDKTVVPDDSISCVDFQKPRSSHSRKSSSRHVSGNDSRRSEAPSDRTVKPARRESSSRHSAATLPVRGPRDEYYGSGGKKRSTLSYS